MTVSLSVGRKNTREALWIKCLGDSKHKQSGETHKQTWNQDPTVELTIVIVEHYYGNYNSETAQEEKRP